VPELGPYVPTDELVSLYLQRTALEVQVQRGPGVQVVQPPAEQVSRGALPTAELGVIGGALLGGLVALGGALAWRSRSGIITSLQQIGDRLHEQGIRPIGPVIDLGSLRVDAATARALYAQLAPASAGPILVVGTSAGSGSATVAKYLAHAVHERVSLPADGAGALLFDDTPWPPDEPVAIPTIVDGGSLESTPALGKAAARASQVVVVAKLKYDVLSELGALVRAMSQYGVPVIAIGTRGRTRAHAAPTNRSADDVSAGQADSDPWAVRSS
jgi:hypothetical protein